MAKNSDNLAIVYDDVSFALGTLGAKGGALANSKIDASRLNGFRVVKVEYWACYSGKTAAEGPIMVGLSFGQASADIDACIEADPQGHLEDRDDGDTKRPLFPLFMLEKDNASSSEAIHGTINPRWSVPEGYAMNYFAYNMDGSALTTGTEIQIFAKIYGVWLRD